MERTANPAPLGLAGFGMTTVLLNIHNAGYFPMDAMILGMGLCFGGMAQVIAGVLEFQKGNTFGMTAFTSYGFFWISLVFLVLAPKLGLAAAPNDVSMAAYLGIWGVFTLFLAIGTLKAAKALQVIFWSLVVLFGLLAVHKATGSELLGRIAGFEGIFCGASALYLGMAEIVNEKLGREVMPIGAPKPASAPVAAEPAGLAKPA